MLNDVYQEDKALTDCVSLRKSNLLLQTLSAEIIAIGSELLAPDRSDTNSLWLTEKLNSIGIEVKLKTIVGDDDARLEEAIKDADAPFESGDHNRRAWTNGR